MGYRIAQIKPEALGRYRLVYGEVIRRDDVVIVWHTDYANKRNAVKYAVKRGRELKVYAHLPLIIVQDYGDVMLLREVVNV